MGKRHQPHKGRGSHVSDMRSHRIDRSRRSKKPPRQNSHADRLAKEAERREQEELERSAKNFFEGLAEADESA